jgi:transcriptional regulator NrdR family protein
MSDREEVKDLYRLIGNYERFSETVLSELRDIKQRLEEGDKRFQTFESHFSRHDMQIIDHEKRLSSFERNGLPRRVKRQIDGTAVATAALFVWELLKRLFGVPL